MSIFRNPEDGFVVHVLQVSVPFPHWPVRTLCMKETPVLLPLPISVQNSLWDSLYRFTVKMISSVLILQLLVKVPLSILVEV